jgi:hypothetical protein
MSAKQSKGRDYSGMLIWSAAVVTVVRYAAAFVASDMGEITGPLSEAVTFFLGLSGIGMGVLDVFGGTYLFDGWRHAIPAQGKRWTIRFRALTFLVFGLIISGVFILVPFTVSRVRHESMDAVLIGNSLWWWAVLVNVTPYFIIGGVAIGNQIVKVNSESSVNYRQVSETTRENGSDWRKISAQLSEKQIEEIANGDTGTIQYKYGITERTARNWRKSAAAMLSKIDK